LHTIFDFKSIARAMHKCTLSVIAYYTQPGLNCVLHSAGGPYITFIAIQMDKGFAGTHQLYRQRVCFFLPLRLLTLDRHNQCKKIFKSSW
jgi:hypothetical protein